MRVVAITGVMLVFAGALLMPWRLPGLMKAGPRRRFLERLGLAAMIAGGSLFLLGVLA